MHDPLSPLRQAIAAAHRREEAACVADLMAEYGPHRPSPAAVEEQARHLIAAVRSRRRGASGVDHLMHEFSLSSQEGVALMCLAEALLRIPDTATADRLIRDKLSQGNWQAHLGHSDSLFVNAAAWGLLITGRLLSADEHGALGTALGRLLSRGGEPLIRHSMDFAMRLLGQQFVMGQSIGAALARSREQEPRGYRHSFDMLGEAALTAADAEAYTRAYHEAIQAIGASAHQGGGGRGIYAGPGISIKLSALHPRYCRAQKARVMAELLPRLKALLLEARHHDLGVNIDAEESERLELSLDLLQALALDHDLAGWNGLGFVVQAYQKRAPFVVDFLIALARRADRRFMLRLVKGAYWDSEIKRAQVEGLDDYPVYTRKAHTDLAYLACARRLLQAPDALYPQFATHNAHTVAAVTAMARELAVDDYEFQCLHGMGETLYDQLVGPARPCRIYAPVGSHQTLLPYLVRRLLENGANSSFVNRLVDEAVSVEELLADPLEQARTSGGQPHPRLPRPPDIYLPRRNSRGLDLHSETALQGLEAALTKLAGHHWEAAPVLAGPAPLAGAPRPIRNPGNREEVVGMVREATPDMAEAAIALALDQGQAWPATPPARRAAILERGAELLEQRQSELISLGLREAGKTWPNALAEVREAVDFLRYYAAQIRQLEATAPTPARPLVCISPWNFPLAIFIGQVSAALAAGYPVIAKPAAQTPLIAALAVSLLHQAGMPPGALQLLPGPGQILGNALSADARIGGVLFTGSTAVARLIARNLATHQPEGAGEPLLVAETGGINAMVVDSSALPEQVVQDVLTSAFDSAGQRCSALRLLCLQEEIADRVLSQLQQAMAELSLGDPRQLATDLGPVIDQAAREQLESHIAAMAAVGHPIHRPPLPQACERGSFVAPTLIHIEHAAQLTREVFGPVLHVLRYRAEALESLVTAINSSGYGLTFGLHSRIDGTIRHLTSRIRAGNLYVNRNMVGAVVGVQPFGGEGLSGTGPKAGGPWLLPRLLGLSQAPSLTGADSPGPDPRLAALLAWAESHDQPELAQHCRRYRESALANADSAVPLGLPGPTGERNSWHTAPRGTVLCLGPGREDYLHQLAAVFASGNRASLPDDEDSRELGRLLPPALAGQLAWAAMEIYGAAAVLLCASPSLAARHRRCLAAGDGPLVPVVEPSKDGTYPLFRLRLERVVSINTTAAGGNTSLMTMAG